MDISLEALSIRFRRGAEAVRDVTLRVGSGEFVALVGPSGCGKSTILNAIAGLLDPDEAEVTGRVLVGGTAAGARGARRLDLGYVFQRDALLPWRTLLGNVEVGLAIRGMGRADRDSRAREMMALAGLTGFEHYYPHQVSGGMRQRVSLIRTLAYRPTVTLMDEPFGALDAQNRMHLQSELLRIWQQAPTTMLFVTHDLAEAIVLAQRVVLMSNRPGTLTRVFDIAIPYPRDPFALRGTPEFARLEVEIWNSLRDEFAASAAAS